MAFDYKTLAEYGNTPFKAGVEKIESAPNEIFSSLTTLLGGYRRISKEIVLGAVTTTHHAGDVIGNVSGGVPSVTTHNLPLAGRKVGGTGSVMAVEILTDNPLWTTAVSMIIYDGAGPGSFIADHDAMDLIYADKDKKVCQIDFGGFNKLAGGVGGAAWTRMDGINRPFTCDPASQDLYFQIWTPGVSSAQTSGQKFYISVGILQD